MCSHKQVKTRVLVSPSNYEPMEKRYEPLKKMAAKQGGSFELHGLRLLADHHLNTERIKTLMATAKDVEPLYMHAGRTTLSLFLLLTLPGSERFAKGPGNRAPRTAYSRE